MRSQCEPEFADRRADTDTCLSNRLLDCLSRHRAGVRIDRLLEIFIDGVEAVCVEDLTQALKSLYADGRIAGYGTMVCLPEQVSLLREGWLLRTAMLLRPNDPYRGQAENEGVKRLMSWTGWNIPVLFDHEMAALG